VNAQDGRRVFGQVDIGGLPVKGQLKDVLHLDEG
jgi:hypothetical protein